MLVTKGLSKLYLSNHIREGESKASVTILKYLLGRALQSATSKCTLVGFGLSGKNDVFQDGRKLLAWVIAAFPPA